MKNILIALATASLFACNSDSKSDLDTKSDMLSVDTAGAYKSNASADTASLIPVAAPVAPPVTPPTKPVATSVKKTPKAKVVRDTVYVATPTPAPATTTTDNDQATAPAPEEKKKGMSSATKGAVIGGVGGAIGGAIISKKKGKGAIIGGAVGAAGGYILGRKKDKKEAAADTIDNR